MLRVGEAERPELVRLEVDFAAGRVQRDGEAVVVVDAGDLAEAAVLDPRLPGRTVLAVEDHAIVFVEAVGLLGVRDLAVAEFAALLRGGVGRGR